MGNLQNTRILRFLIVLTAVILTIFIYASYSNSQNLLPLPMRTIAIMPAPETQFQSYSNNNYNILIDKTNLNFNDVSKQILNVNGTAAAAFVNNMTNIYKPIKIQKQQGHQQEQLQIHNQYHHRLLHLNDGSSIGGKTFIHHYQHREPTIDENANNNNETILTNIDDLTIDTNNNNNNSNTNSDLLQEEQYVQTIDRALEHINQTTARESKQIHIFSSIKQKELLNLKKQDVEIHQQQQQQKPQLDSILNDNNNGNNNKITDSDVLIPTLNVQKFIENADTLLKSLTLQQQKQQLRQQKNHVDTENVFPNNLPLPQSNSFNKQPIAKKQFHIYKDISVNHKLPMKANLEAVILAGEKSPILSAPVSPKSATTTLLKINSSKSMKLQQKQQLNENWNGPMVVSKASVSPPPSNKKNVTAKSIPHSNGPLTIKINDNINVLPPFINSKNLTPSGPVTFKGNGSATKVANGHQMEMSTLQLYESGHRNNEIDVERLCPKKGINLKLLIIITSAQNHADARMAIRQTWGHFGTRRDVSTAFILGRTTNETLSLAITQENFIFGDLIRGQFIDSYNNLTLKTLSALEWVDKNCPKVKFILKTDDDMFINVPKLLQFLDNHLKDKRTIFGRLAKKWKPIRNKKSKYYVSTGQFGATIFPPFTTGPAYVITNDCIHDLYTKALQQVYLKLEDVFTTGIVAQQLGINRIHVNEFLNRRIVFNPCNIRKAVSIHMVKANEQFDLWRKLLDQTTKCK